MKGRGRKAARIAQRGPCRVYWGSHGCSKPRGHTGIHYCSSGCWIPSADSTLFGEDVVPGDKRVLPPSPTPDTTSIEPKEDHRDGDRPYRV